MRILTTIAKLRNLHTKSVDFVQAYPQALIKSAIYLHPPAGVILNSSRGDMVLKLIRNLYGLKDAGKTWFEHLTEGLEGLGFKLTESDPCIYVRGSNVIVLYVDDCIIMSNSGKEANAVFKEINDRGYKMTDEGTMGEYLRILITHNPDGTYRMSQPHLIDSIISSIPSMKDARSATTPAAAGNILTKDLDGEKRK